MQRDFVEPGSGPRRRLWAETIGCRVPRIDCTGRVAAVFERACNVTLEGGGLVTLLAPDAGNVAHGIRLAGNQRFERRLRSGMSLRLADDRAIFDGGTVTVMLSAARTWTPRLRPGSCDWNGRSLRAALQVRDLLRD